MTEPKITKKFIEVVNGGITHLINRRHIRLITAVSEKSVSCNIYVVEMDDPIVVPLSLDTLKIRLGLYD